MLNRRSFLRTASAASAAVAVPVCATAAQNPSMTPDERIDAALAEIVIALRERYPNCPIRIENVDLNDEGMINIITHCGDDAPGALHRRDRKLSGVKPKLYFDTGGPLLADDVTGTTAFADWERGANK